MVFEVLSEKAPAMALPAPRIAQDDDDDNGVACCPAPARSMPPAVLAQLLRSAVALQAEGLLRTAGALSGVWGNVLDRTAWIERDARDLSALTSAAVAAGAGLPAGLDSGAGDPDHPSSVVEGLLASHEALVRVLREIAGSAATDPKRTHPHTLEPTNDLDGANGWDAKARDTADPCDVPDVAEPESWHRLVRGVLDRREEEIVLLRAAGAVGQLPAEQAYRRGRPPRH